MADSDDFSGGALDAGWSFLGPAGVAHALGADGADAFLELSTPDGNFDVWNVNKGARVVQATADVDFTYEARFLTTPTERFQMQGLLFEQDAANWLRFDTYSDGANLYAFAGITIDGASSVALNVQIPGGAAPYLRVDRSGDEWTFEYSQDGATWTVAGVFTHEMTVATAGVFAGNTGNADGYVARVDYFESAADPIVDEDAALSGPNEAPTAGDDALAATADEATTIAVADLLGNDVDPNGDALMIASFTQPANGALVDNGDGTLTYAPNAGFAGADSFTYTVTDGEFSDQATATIDVAAPAQGLFSDDFADANLDPAWMIEGPAGVSGGVGVGAADAFLELAVSGGGYDAWGSNDSARAMQAIGDGDFALETRFLTTPTNQFEIQGLLVEEDAANWIRFDTYSDGTTLRAFAAVTVNGKSSVRISEDIPGGEAPYLRVDRTGDVWTFEYSTDGQTWTLAGSFAHSLATTSAGVFAGNAGPSAGYVARVDYFESAADPIVDEDAGFAPQNAPPVAGDDAFETEVDAPVSIDATTLLANDQDPNGDALSIASFTQPTNGAVTDNGDGTLTYAPNAGYEGTDAFTYTVTDGAFFSTATATISVAPPLAGPASDDFADSALDPMWTIVGPAGISGGVAADAVNGYLELSTPDGAHDLWGANNGARAMQATADVDFTIATRFLTTPTDQYQIQGLLIEQDASNWLRFDTYSDGASLYAFAATTINGKSSAKINVEIPGGAAPYLRVERDGDLWTFEYSPDGVNWTVAGSFTHALAVSEVGLVAGNVGAATGFVARADYFEVASDPIADEDGALNVVNVAPDAVDDAFAVDQDGALTISPAELLANDVDPNEDALIIVSFTQPSNGVVAIDGAGDFVYTPTAGYAGADSFTYTVSDGEFADTATVSLTVASAPGSVASDDFATAALDAMWSIVGPAGVSGGVDDNAADAFLELVTPDGDYDVWGVNNGARAVQSVSDGDFAIETRFLTTPTEQFQMQGLLVEQDASNWVRFDTYSDGSALRAFAAVTVNGSSSVRISEVVPGGSAPFLRVTRDGDLFTFEYSIDGQSWTEAGVFSHALDVSAVGVFAGNVGGATGYAAQVDYFASSADPLFNEDEAYSPPNEPPTANDDALSAIQDAPLTIAAADLVDNDVDPNAGALAIASFTQPTNGVLTDNGDGTLTYTPTVGYAGEDSFTYTVTDGEFSDDATVTLTVAPAPSEPFSDDFAGAALSPLWTTTGPTGAAASIGTDPANSFVELVSPDGDNDIWGANNATRLMQDIADVDMTLEARFLTTPTVQSQMQGFLIEADASNWVRLDTYFDGSNLRAFGAVTINGSSSARFNAVVPEGAAPYLRVDRAGDVWTLEYSQDGENWTTAGSFTYALAATAAGVFAANVGGANGFTAQVDYFESAADPIIDEDGAYSPPNVAPEAADDALSVEQDAALVFDAAALLANDSDLNEDALSISVFSQPANGALVDNGDGTFTYTPDAGFAGPDTFTYTVTDGALTDDATVTIFVTSPPAPAASDDFSDGGLDPRWRFEGIDGFSQVATTATEAFAEIHSPVGVNVSASDVMTTPRLLQDVLDADFQISAGFLSEPTVTFSEHGLLFVQDDANWIRFDLAKTGATLSLIVGVIENGSTSYPLFADRNPGEVTDFRVTRTGDDFVFETSADGQTWTVVHTLTHQIEVNQAGLFAGSTTNSADPNAPGYVAKVDYFETSLDPILNEDGTITPVNVAPIAGDDAFVAPLDEDFVISIADDLLANDVDSNEDAVALASITQPASGVLVDNGDGTLTYTPNAGFSGIDTFTYVASDGALSDAATVSINVTASPPASFVSEDFSAPTLDPRWSIEGPSGVDATLATTVDDAVLSLVTPDGDFDVWDTNNGARAMQAILDEDFQLEARFLTTPTEDFQLQGLLVEADDANWIRFDTFHTGLELRIFAATTTSGSSTARINAAIDPAEAEYLRVSREGDVWTLEHSADGVIWTAAGSFQHGLAVTSAGVFAGNVGQAQGYTAQVDYVFNTATPIADEDASFTPINLAPVAADDTMLTLFDTAKVISVADDLFANDADPNLDPLSLVSFTQPVEGTLVDLGGGELLYTPTAGFEGSVTFDYVVSDGALTDTGTATIFVGNAIQLWHGSTQSFGVPGEGQEWINLLGTVGVPVTSLTYSLNGGEDRVLSVGPDTRRLQNEGDFNVDIAFAELDGSAADDIVEITATFENGATETQTVVVEYEDGQAWPKNYTVDWETVVDPQEAVQIVDGLWDFTADGARPAELGYDRLLVVGDESWDNYEATIQVTTHDLQNVDPLGRDGGGFAFGFLWGGHTEEPVAGFQPRSGYEPGASIFYNNGKLISHSYHEFNQKLAIQNNVLAEDVTYNFTVRVEQVGIYDRLYSLKVWEEGAAEPTDWTIQGLETFSLEEAPATGSLYLNAHYYDVTFGDFTVTEITGRDILQGTDGDDRQIAVDGGTGVGELDVFVGNAGADTFVFGDLAGDYYDDGIGASAGLDDYGFIYDFATGVDQIELAGTASDYVLAEDVAGLTAGTAIFRAGENGDADELIALANGVYNLTLQSDDFVFLEDLIS